MEEAGLAGTDEMKRAKSPSHLPVRLKERMQAAFLEKEVSPAGSGRKKIVISLTG